MGAARRVDVRSRIDEDFEGLNVALTRCVVCGRKVSQRCCRVDIRSGIHKNSKNGAVALACRMMGRRHAVPVTLMNVDLGANEPLQRVSVTSGSRRMRESPPLVPHIPRNAHVVVCCCQQGFKFFNGSTESRSR